MKVGQKKVRKRGLLFKQVDQLSKLYETVDKLADRAKKSRKKPVVRGVKGAGAQEVASAMDTALKARVEVKSQRLHFNYEHQPTVADQEQSRLKKELADQRSVAGGAVGDEARLRELLLRKIEREQMDRDGPDGGEVSGPSQLDIDREQRQMLSQVEEKAKLEDELQMMELQRDLHAQSQHQGYDYGQSYTPPYTPPHDPDRGY